MVNGLQIFPKQIAAQAFSAARSGRCVLAIVTVIFACLTSQEIRADIILIDAANREVHLAAPARRIALNDSLLLLSLALIDPDPIERIAGWATPRRIDQGIYADFKRRFPKIDAIPDIGGVTSANVSVESILSVTPDLYVVSIWQTGWEQIVETLDKAGIPVIFLDGPSNAGRDPAEATAFSIQLLGQATGQDNKAKEYGDFVRSRYRNVEDRLRGVTDRPKVLIDAFAGTDCCSTPGRNNRLTENLELAGGTVIGADVIPGYQGRLSPEAVIALAPSIYIGTGGSQLVRQGGLVLGGDVDAGSARTSLETVLSHSVRRDIKAVRDQRAYGISHQISISALSVLAFECFAKWVHPELFGEIDPSKTLEDINNRFLAVPLTGTFWLGIKD